MPTAARPGWSTATSRACPTRRTRWRRTTRAAGSPTPTTPTRAGASSTTAAAATAGCGPATTTSSRSATTASATSPSSGRAVRSWTTFSRYFAGILAETYPNRFVQHAAQTDRLHEQLRRLDAAHDLGPPGRRRGSSGRYYYSDLPFLALWGGEVHARSATRSPTSSATRRRRRCRTCPTSTRRSSGEEPGTSGDDHPHADIRNGEAFLNRIYRAVTTSPAWSRTVARHQLRRVGRLLRPRPATDARRCRRPRAAGDVDGRLGFRVPCLLVSPLRPPRHVARRSLRPHLDPAHDRVALRVCAPLTVRDATANNLADELLPRAKRWTPQFDVPAGAVRRGLPGPGPGRRVAPPAASGAARAGSADGASGRACASWPSSTGWPV